VFVQRRELTWGIRTGSRLADACLNLSPIAHWPTLYQWYASRASNSREKGTGTFGSGQVSKEPVQLHSTEKIS
jgi:hypothetical protein